MRATPLSHQRRPLVFLLPASCPISACVAVYRLGSVDTKRIMNTVTEEEFRAFYVHWMEVSLAHQRATCHGTVEVFDLRGLSFSQIYPPGMRMLARTLKIGQSHVNA